MRRLFPAALLFFSLPGCFFLVGGLGPAVCDEASFTERCDGDALILCDRGFESRLTCEAALPGSSCDPDNRICNACGDGILNDGVEQCDNGEDNANISDACRTTCELPTCGDGIVDIDSGDEQCDLGEENGQPGGDCTADCQLVIPLNCGDGIIQDEENEECDDGDQNAFAPDACRPNCKLPFCGDSIEDPSLGETCDDGNDIPDDGCDDCQATGGDCGNGTVEAGEGCDDGNTSSGDGCSDLCQLENQGASGLFAGNEADSTISFFDLEDGSANTIFDSNPPGGGPFPFTMTGLAVQADQLFLARPIDPFNPSPNSDGRIWVMPVGGTTNDVAVFADADPNGNPLNAFALAVSPQDGLLYALTLGPTQIIRYGGADPAGEIVHDPGITDQTLGFAISSEGELFYSNFDARQILVTSPGLDTVAVFADSTDGLNSPLGLALDDQDRLYVADASGALFRFDSPHNGIEIADAGSGLFAPIAVVVDPRNGAIFVANACSGQQSNIVLLDSNGAVLFDPLVPGDSGFLACTRSLALLP